MTDERMALIELVEKQADSDLVREMLAFAADRIMELEVELRTGAAKGARSPLREVQRNGYRERFQFHLANATGVEVFSLDVVKTEKVQMLANYSPNRRSHEVQRILAPRDRLRVSWHSGWCSAPPA